MSGTDCDALALAWQHAASQLAPKLEVTALHCTADSAGTASGLRSWTLSVLLLLRLSSVRPTMDPRAQCALLKALPTEARHEATVEWWGVQDWQLMSRIDSVLMQDSIGSELAIELPHASLAVSYFQLN